MSLLYRGINEALKPLLGARTPRFEMKREEIVFWDCYLAVMSYCCDTHEDKDTSCVKQGTDVKRPCVTCLTTMFRHWEPTWLQGPIDKKDDESQNKYR